VKRRGALATLGGIAAALTLSARAQKASTPVIGFLGGASHDQYVERLRAFREGLKDAGYIEGQNVAIEYRWAEGKTERLPALAAELVRHQVTVIVAAGGSASALAAKAATSSIPIVFGTGVDPKEAGLVTSLNRPGGNVTGVTSLNVDIAPKRLELMHELLPSVTIFGVLVDPTNAAVADAALRGMQEAARMFKLRLHVLEATPERDFDGVFATLAQLHAGGLIIGPFSFFVARTEQLAALTLRHAVPAIYESRRFVTAGGLLSYGANETEYYGLVGSYTGRILKGERPGDLPVQQSTKFQLLINLKTARVLGITIPPSLLARADEVIQ